MNITESFAQGHISIKGQNQSPNPSLDDDSLIETPNCCPLYTSLLLEDSRAFAPSGPVASTLMFVHWRGQRESA